MRDVTPRRVDQALTLRAAQVRAALEKMRRDSARLEDPRERRAVLNELPDPDPDAPDFEHLAALAAIFDEPVRPGRSDGRRRKKRRR